jgi:hypothetical protein
MGMSRQGSRRDLESEGLTMSEEKSYVGMMTCFYCGEPSGILLDRRLRNTLPRQAVYDREPCDKCKSLLSQGVMFISVRDGEPKSDNPYRTGKLSVIRDDAVKRMPIDEELKKLILKSRVCFIPDEVWAKLGFPTENIDNTKGAK